ncbi:MAG TPA: tetratricopeptide repeat protein [Acidimicrobiales bacterium]|nr:tetratricopeptide repeat protein [Acidimicrobiales bacterium]
MTNPNTLPAGPGGVHGRVRRTPITAALLAAGIALLVVGVAGVAFQRRPSAGSPAAAASVPTTAATPLARLEKKVADDPGDASAWAALGAAHVDHARVNSDPSSYPKAERALDRSLALDGDGNWEALASQGALAAGRHDFAKALRFSEQARELQPQSSFILGIIVDSLTELGRYPEAVDAAQAMVDLRPDLASYARVSYQRELHGDIPGAIDAMQAALRASSAPGDRAFAAYHLGELEWQGGDVPRAEARYQEALRADPTAMQAVAGLGRVAASRGDLAAAISRYEEAVAGFPDPEALKELGELHLLDADREAAELRFRQAARENAKQAAGGVAVDLEIALFSADHRRNLDAGLAAASREWGRRQSIHVADALAWQLFVHGEHENALVYADKALALGSRNGAFHFHRAEIHRALGNRDAAVADYRQALAISPNFSLLHRGPAQRALADLAG